MVRKPSAREPRQKPGAALADKLARLGIARDADLVLHLPLRYEDHTRLVSLGLLQAAAEQQVEGTVVTADIQYRPRRKLVCLIADPSRRDAQLILRYFTFYPSQQKVLAPGHRVRVFGGAREGHFGREMVHPQVTVVELGARCPTG